MERIHVTNPWYKRSAVLNLLLSTIALILTQLPPISRWFPSTKVVVDVPGRIGLPNQLGITSLQFVADLRNNGNQNVDISNLRIELTYPQPDKSKKLLCDTYLGPYPQSFPLSTVTLIPGQTWTQTVACNPELSVTEDEAVNRYRRQIQSTMMVRSPGANQEADPAVVQQASDFFLQALDLQKGPYKATLYGRENNTEVKLRTLEFTLYEGQIETLKSQRDDFKLGLGIFLPTNQTKQVWATASKSY